VKCAILFGFTIAPEQSYSWPTTIAFSFSSMGFMTLWKRLLFVFAAATDTDLVRQNQFLLVQVQILQSKLPKNRVTSP
jgi:hypothetical protein